MSPNAPAVRGLLPSGPGRLPGPGVLPRVPSRNRALNVPGPEVGPQTAALHGKQYSGVLMRDCFGKAKAEVAGDTRRRSESTGRACRPQRAWRRTSRSCGPASPALRRLHAVQDRVAVLPAQPANASVSAGRLERLGEVLGNGGRRPRRRTRRPSGRRPSPGRPRRGRPGACRPAPISASTFWRLTFDHALRARRGVKRCTNQSVVDAPARPSIQPKQSAPSTALAQSSDATPVCFFAILLQTPSVVAWARSSPPRCSSDLEKHIASCIDGINDILPGVDVRRRAATAGACGRGPQPMPLGG